MPEKPESRGSRASLDAVLADYMRRVDRGEPVDPDVLIGDHPELANELRGYFSHAAALAGAGTTATADFAQNTTPRSSGGLEVRCPNCHQPTEVAVDTTLTDLTCSACGSHFSLVDQTKATRMAPSLTKLGRFELIERLGVGGFGSVWKARDKELDRTVAIKIPRAVDMSAEDQEKFFREARAAAQLKHPSIVSVHEVGRDGDSIYIVSDFVRGVTLGDWLTGQRLTSREAAELCAKIADALHHAHEQGVVHRDLKPANIMMDYDGQPHLMDFGLARRDTGEVTVTIDGHVLGTPAYMSPEQAEGKAHTADRRSDIYSLGVILFQLLTGELPFRGNARMLIKQVIHDEPPSPRTLNGNVSKDLETITQKCLEKEPARRYATAEAVVGDLTCWLNNKPIQARPVGRAATAWKWMRRNPTPAISILAVLLSLSLGAATAVRFAALQSAEAKLARAAEAKALSAETQAQIERDAAAADRERAQKDRDEAQRQLVRNYVNKGIDLANWQVGTGTIGGGLLPGAGNVDSSSAWGSGDPMQAALWFLQALEIDPDRRNEVMHRTRIASVLAQCPQLVGLCFHPDRVTEVILSPDNSHVLTRMRGREAYYWDATRSGLAIPPLVHDGLVLAGAISADGLLLATGGADSVAKVWDAKTGTVRITPLVHPGPVTAVSFHPRGKWLATGCDDQIVRLWNLDTGLPSEIRMQCNARPTWIQFSTDGSKLLTWDASKQTAVWDPETGKALIHSIAHNPLLLRSFPPSWDADASRLLTVNSSKTVLWDIASNEALAELQESQLFGGDRRLSAAILTPDGTKAVFCQDVTGATLWDFDSKKRTVLHQPRQGRYAACSPDGKHIATTSSGGRVQLWLVEEGTQLFDGFLSSTHVETLQFSADSRHLLTIDAYDRIRITEVLPDAPAPYHPVESELDSPQRMTPIELGNSGFKKQVLSSDGQWQLEYGGQIGARLVSRRQGSEDRIEIAPEREILFAKFGNTGDYFLISSNERIELRRLPDAEEIIDAVRIDDPICGAWFDNSDRRVLAIASGTGYLLDRSAKDPLLTTLRKNFRREGNTGTAFKSAISSDGNVLVLLGTAYDSVHIYDIQTSGLAPLIDPAVKGYVWAADFGESTSRFILASSSAVARLYDTHARAVGPPLQHNVFVRDAALGSDGRKSLVRSGTRDIFVWDAESGQLLSYPIYTGQPIVDMWFSRGDDTIVADSGDGRQYWWRLPSIDLPLPQLVRYVQFVVSHEIDDTDGLLPLEFGDPKTTRLAWLAARGINKDLLETPASLRPAPHLEPSIEQLRKMVGQQAEVTMRVMLDGGREELYLNSLDDYTDPNCFTIKIMPTALRELRTSLKDDPNGFYYGKLVWCRGTIESDAGKLQITVNDPATELKIVAE